MSGAGIFSENVANGPNSAGASRSPFIAMAPKVAPWKLGISVMIFVRCGWPVATAYWRRNLIACSFASEPPDDRWTRSKPGPARRATRSVSSSLASCRVLRT